MGDLSHFSYEDKPTLSCIHSDNEKMYEVAPKRSLLIHFDCIRFHGFSNPYVACFISFDDRPEMIMCIMLFS